MNRVIFFIAFIILLIVPFSINSVNDDGVSYFEIVKKLKNEIISIVIKTEITSPNELAAIVTHISDVIADTVKCFKSDS